MPLLFAVTLFVSASLLFMVQPMVGKMILPLLGGSPAVWNACMVFFQALLLLGYLYAHHVASRYEPKKQWVDPPRACSRCRSRRSSLAVMLGTRHSPIAIAESLAPTGESSPILERAGAPDGRHRHAVLRRLDQRPAAAEVVRVHRPPVGPRPVLPLRREQRRQPDLAARLPAVHRAEPDASWGRRGCSRSGSASSR